MAIPRTRIVKLTRVTCFSGRTLAFAYDGGNGETARTRFIPPENMPPFDGDSGWFEIERLPARPFAFERALREVEQPRWALS